MTITSSACLAGTDDRSTSETPRMLVMPIRRAVRITRRAISPRLAMNSLRITSHQLDTDERRRRVHNSRVVDQEGDDNSADAGVYGSHEFHRLNDADHRVRAY